MKSWPWMCNAEIFSKTVETLRQERNSGSKVIGQLMREGKKDEAEAQKQRMTEVGDQIKALR